MSAQQPESELLGDSPAMLRLRRQIEQAGRVDAPVMIGGESGCGKELVAQAICQASRRRDAPLVAINCGAISPSLAQSELFGHVRGAFTGADRDRVGWIEAAHGGTVFLDEVAELSAELQASLLRILQEQTLMRVGSSTPRRVDVRILAATHVDLSAAVAQGRFRQDLYYRLNVLTLRVPPLRERGQDIVLLAHMAYARYAAERAPQLQGFCPSALQAMQAYRWPGNVRELINRVRRAMVLAEGPLISVTDLGLDDGHAMGWMDVIEPPLPLDGSPPIGTGDSLAGRDGAPLQPASVAALAPLPGLELPDGLAQARRDAERAAVLNSLAQAGRNISAAARRLGVSRMTLYRLMSRHGIEP